MLQVFESLSKTFNMLPQQNVVSKVALFDSLHAKTEHYSIVTLKFGSGNTTFISMWKI